MRRLLALLLLVTVPAAARAVNFRYVAFGDSLTSGNFPPGVTPYPPRLKSLLLGAGREVAVINKGLGGETTAQGLTRIDSVLAAGDQVLLLMEGTNDIFKNISPETAHTNLLAMADKAALLGIETVHLTIIPMRAQGSNSPHAKNGQAADLADMVAASATAAEQGLVDLFDLWSAIPDLYATYYFQDQDDPLLEDPVGHPTDLGHQRLANDVFNEQLLDLPGAATPTAPLGDVTTATPGYLWDEAAGATWYRLWVRDAAGTGVYKKWHKASDSCAGTACSVTPADPLPDGGDYTWTVLPRNPGGWGPETVEQAFTYWDAPPAAAASRSPGGPTFATDPVFLWDEVGDATRYRLEVDDSAASPVHDAWYDAGDVCAAGDCSVQPALGLPTGDYLWRVTSSNPAGDAQPSPDRAFEVRSCPPDPDLTVGPGELAASQLYEACGTITVIDFAVLDGGDATFLAVDGMVVDNGTRVDAGGRATFVID